ncbi:gap junction delta-3 protein [Fundulus heteroclitus]|uniref:gap junction delta-3 protein n=1 Tax=Fundulus heteroclitus TaxID=8078 RepID=UPI00165A6475|nr:gap junction delta-3 protein [Fundulus heteroclitus]XP_035998337.1 gap junction delta-3 protein [Fundulus heteroclitus]
MGEWDSFGKLFEVLQNESPMLGRFWLFLMLVFRIVILGTVASDMFEDEQAEFTCNTLQPGCRQVCYDDAFPISQYRFWVFHIVLIATPSLLFLLYASHYHTKKASKLNLVQSSIHRYREDPHIRRLYIVNVIFRILAEVGFLVVQWKLYGFKVKAQFPCSRFPCPYIVDCFTSRPAEKTIFLYFYFAVGAVSAFASFAELFYAVTKWFCCRYHQPFDLEDRQNLQNLSQDDFNEKPKAKTMSDSSVRLKGGSVKSSKKVSSVKSKRGKYVNPRTLMV